MWSAFTATFHRQLISTRRAYPWSFFIGHILDGIYMTVFAYLSYHFIFQGELNEAFVQVTGTSNYLSYVILGGVFNSFAVSLLMIVSRMLITEMREGTLESLMLTPSSRKGYFLGGAAQGLTRTMLEAAAIIVIGFLFGLQLEDVNIGLLAVSLVLFCFAIFSQALLLGSLMLAFRDTYITQNTLFVVMMLVSGVTFPPEFLPGWLQAISSVMPLTYGLELFRAAMLSGEWNTSLLYQLGILAGLGFVYFMIGSFAIKRMERTVMEKHFG